MRWFTGILFACVWLAALEGRADEIVYLRSEPVVKRDVVRTVVSRTRGNYFVLDLGYTHGVTKDSRFLVIRSQQGLYEPIALLRVAFVDDGFSLAELTEGSPPQITDEALIPAEELDLWKQQPRVRTAYDTRKERQSERQGYDTRQLGPPLISELLRDDRMTRYQQLRTGIARELRTGGDLNKDLRPIERYAQAIGGESGAKAPPLPPIRSALEESDLRFAQAVATATGALGLVDVRSRFADQDRPSLRMASQRFRNLLMWSAIRHLGEEQLSEADVRQIEQILTEMVERRRRGELAQTAVESVALARLHREISHLENSLMWSRFISAVTVVIPFGR